MVDSAIGDFQMHGEIVGKSLPSGCRRVAEATKNRRLATRNYHVAGLDRRVDEICSQNSEIFGDLLASCSHSSPRTMGGSGYEPMNFSREQFRHLLRIAPG